MRKTLAILSLNFKQAARDKFFLGGFFLFLPGFLPALGKLSPKSEKVLRNAGLSGIELTAVFLSIFSFTFSFHREKESRILEVYLTDFPRASYLTGKLAGYLLVSLLYIILCAAGYGGILIARGSFHPACIAALYPVFLKVALVIGWTAVFSCLFSSWMVSLLCSFSLYIAVELLPAALKIISTYGGAGEKFFIGILRAFLPAFGRLDIKAAAVYGCGRDFLADYSLRDYLRPFLWTINLCIFQKKNIDPVCFSKTLGPSLPELSF